MATTELANTAEWTPELKAEMAAMTSTQRAAVLMLLLGEEQAAEIVKYLSPKEVQALGGAMVQAASLSQNAVNVVLDEFVEMLKKDTGLNIMSYSDANKLLKDVQKKGIEFEGMEDCRTGSRIGLQNLRRYFDTL